MAEFTDNLVEFLEDKLQEANPDIAVGEGTAVRDLFIKPFSVIFQPIVDEILRIRQNLSLEGAAALDDEDLDRLAANFFVTRKAGSKATGTVRLFFSEAVDEFIPQGTVFVAANGVRFLSLADTTITSSGLKLNTFGELFFQDLLVEAENVGTSGNIAANLVTDIVLAGDKVVDVTNPAAFTGGTARETNAELVARLAIAITFRNLINTNGAKLILLENFSRLLDVLVVGKGATHTVEGESLGTGDGVTLVYQLSETEDVIAASVDVFLDVQDELVGTGDNATTAYQLDFFPLDASTLELRKGASFAAGTPLTVTTHYTVNAGTGAITLTAAGVTFLGTDQLRAKYKAGPLDASLVSADFSGAVTFTVAPSAGAAITADFSYHLMRRDRLSGNNLVLGDDTFGTQTNVHIGGKVDYYLKFPGLEQKEVRINSTKAENFLFTKATSDPSPTATQQYVTDFPLPFISVRNVETVDPGTNLPSGTFLTEFTGAGAPPGPNQFKLEILPNKLNLNMSMRQKIKLLLSSDVVGNDIFLRYFTHQDFAAVQAFIDDPVNRVVTADLLARAPMPVFVDLTINYSRASGGPAPEEVEQAVTDFINSKKLGGCISIFDLTVALSEADVRFVQLPITMSAERINLDFGVVSLSSTNKIEVPPNFQFIARTITVNEVPLDSCDEI